MKSIILFALFTLVSCGQKTVTKTVEIPAPKLPAVLSIINNWTPTSDVVVIEQLNLASLTLNTVGAIESVFACNGNYGNNVLVNGIASGEVIILGEAQKGVIQFGNARYVGASDPYCNYVSKELYEYEIIGDELELCMVNYPYCTTYTKSL